MTPRTPYPAHDCTHEWVEYKPLKARGGDGKPPLRRCELCGRCEVWLVVFRRTGGQWMPASTKGKKVASA